MPIPRSRTSRPASSSSIPHPGEIIELGYAPKAGGAPVTLLIEPKGAMHGSHAGAPGSFAELLDGHVVVTEVVAGRAGFGAGSKGRGLRDGQPAARR